MGYRLSKIYTKTGDDGTTGLADGSRISKTAIRVGAYGEVDELNSHLGWLLTLDLPDQVTKQLTRIQHELFSLGGELATPGGNLISGDMVTQLETEIDTMNTTLPPLKNFILPGGSQAAACCHIARTVCRRAERSAIALHEQEPINAYSMHYLNRLSDWLFVLARHVLQKQGVDEVLWAPT